MSKPDIQLILNELGDTSSLGTVPLLSSCDLRPWGSLKRSRTLGCVTIQSWLQWMQPPRRKALSPVRREVGEKEDSQA